MPTGRGHRQSPNGALIRILFALVPLAAVAAQQPAEPDPRFTFHDNMIPMRDGIKLHTTYFIPKAQAGPLPVLFVRTPYGVPGPNARLGGAYTELIADGYIFAFQDIRGKYGSEGTFVMQRAPRPVDSGSRPSIDESTDAYDSID
jgi:uncharacterized protein